MPVRYDIIFRNQFDNYKQFIIAQGWLVPAEVYIEKAITEVCPFHHGKKSFFLLFHLFLRTFLVKYNVGLGANMNF